MDLEKEPNLTDESTEITAASEANSVESEAAALDNEVEELAVVDEEPIDPRVLLLQELLELRHLGKIEHFIIRPDEECILICAKEEPDKPRIYFLSKELNTAEYNHFEATVLQSDYLNLKEWAPEYHYKEGDLIYESHAVYRAKEEHVSSDQTFADDISKWQQIVSTLNNSSTTALSSVVNITGKDDTLTITDGMGATSKVTINNVQNAKQDVHGVDLDSYIHQIVGKDDTLTITDGKGNASKIVVNKVQNAKQDMHGVDLDSYVYSVIKANSDNTFTVTDGKGTSSNITINNVQNAQKDMHGVALDSYIHSITRVNNDLKIVAGDGTAVLVPITCVSAYIQQITGNDDTLTITDSSGNVSTITINNVQNAKKDAHGTDLDSYVRSVTGTNDTLTITENTAGNGVVGVAVTTDNKNYYTYSAFTGWQQVLDVATQSMTVSALNSISGTDWDNLVANVDGIGFAYVLDVEASTDTANVDSIVFNVNMNGTWKRAVHGTDYDYAYSNSTLTVDIMSNGDYKINYPN